MNVVEVKNLCKNYGDFPALQDVDFSVRENEILGLLGPNGAGKTTTMRILTTFIPPTAGEVKVQGYDITKQPIEVRKITGYMPENPPLYDEMRVSKFLKFVGEIRGIPRKKLSSRLDYLAQVCGLEQVWNKYIAHISKGYRQRVGLASAILADPPILILDEPTIGLDPEQIRYTRELIKTLGENHSVLLSTHILHEAEITCDRVAIINEGKILAIGSPAELAEKIRKINAVRVKLSGPPNEVERSILQLDGVIRVIPQGANDTFTVEFEPKWKTHHKITELAHKNGWHILELTPIEASLEEVFLKIVSGKEETE
ncbi:ABC transporter ATP-binding protein [bacterium]|nr:MAG: ABC transporter ATP-binding protein [bacterium]